MKDQDQIAGMLAAMKTMLVLLAAQRAQLIIAGAAAEEVRLFDHAIAEACRWIGPEQSAQLLADAERAVMDTALLLRLVLRRLPLHFAA